MVWLRITFAILFAVALDGCIAPSLQEPLRGNKELNAVLDAYKKQNAEVTARREAVMAQGIRDLTVTNGATSEGPLVTVELDRASLPIVIGRILNEASVSYVVEPGLLRGTVTSRLTKVPLLRAVNALLEPFGLIATMRDHVMAIKEREIDGAAFLPRSNAGDGVIKTIANKPAADKDNTKKNAGDEKSIAPSVNKPAAAQIAGTAKGDKAPSDEAGAAKPQNKSVITREVALTHLDVPMISAFLEGLAKTAPSETDPGLRFSPQPYTGTVFLSGSPEHVDRAAKALRGADRDPAHVVIEVLVVEFDTGSEEELGVDLKNLTTKSGNQFITAFGSLTNPALTYAAGVKNPRSLRAEIQALVSRNKARIIARPYLTTTSGRKAKIEITKDQYIIVQQAIGGAAIAAIAAPQAVATGVKLEILPQVARDGKVRMDVAVEQSQFVTAENENVATEVAKNVAQTTMEVESGQAILIGGMSQYLSASVNSGLPWLRHIPILNMFFAKFEADSRRQEVLVYLTPYIVWSPDLNSPIPESDAFGPQEPRDLFTTIEGTND